MAIQSKVLTVAIPLWLVTRTEAPHWLISGTMLLNTLLVIAFQIRAGRNIDNRSAGATAYRRSGVAFLLACALISMSAGVPSWAAATLLPAAVAVHTIGELWHSAAGSKSPSPSPPSTPPANTSEYSDSAPAWQKQSDQPCSSTHLPMHHNSRGTTPPPYS
ncbi:hypothetical protein [Streptomyces sp. B3I7]|uniref:hypothetical protein n=1 Tax=Streptomyces sp. B3I7 TaxID=3042269 RepID=UPI0027D92734|nr:hypothetical protein [Streptomyces sp. B3I7]